MYDEKILSQLNALNYLHVIKKSNVNIMSKKNAFGDMVKFYAQINSNDVVEKISYKATGCTYFLVFCNHFCQLVEGKSIKEALKINAESLEQFVELDENRKHVTGIIINTFALLIKKYRKGVEKGTILPVGVEEKKSAKPAEKVKESTNKKEEIKTTEKATTKKSDENKMKQANNIVALKSMVNTSKSKNEKTSKKDDTKKEIDTLSKMINKISKNDKKQEDENSKKLHSLNENLASIRKQKETKDNVESVKNKETKAKKDSSKKSDENTQSNKKKGLFGWLKKK